jgi:hypothetical protein
MNALWSAGLGHRFSGASSFAQRSVWAVRHQAEKRRQAAALQNVGAPTFKVVLEVACWSFGVRA